MPANPHGQAVAGLPERGQRRDAETGGTATTTGRCRSAASTPGRTATAQNRRRTTTGTSGTRRRYGATTGSA